MMPHISELTPEEAELLPRDIPFTKAEIGEVAQYLGRALSQREIVEINVAFFYRIDFYGFLHLLELLPFPVTINLPYQPGKPLSMKRTANNNPSNGLYARCFGTFELFYDGRPVAFKRHKTKELFAYLIDRNGACCTSGEIGACLWEEASDPAAIKHNVRNLVSDLKATMTGLGLSDVIIRRRDCIGLQLDKIDCDYLRHLSGTSEPQEVYRGEYMEQYSWAEATKATLLFEAQPL